MTDTDNASILTNACAALERCRADERALETEIAVLNTRLDMTREFIGMLSGKRRGRPRKVHEQDATPESEAATGDMFTALSA